MKRLQQLRKQQVQFSKQLNWSNTLTIATYRNTKLLAKIINFQFQYPQLQQLRNSTMGENINIILKRIATLNQSIIYKPQYYYYQGKCFYVLSDILPYNLQNAIMFHRLLRIPFSAWFVQNVGLKLYDSINRIKNSRSQFYHGNLKPSNIFFNINTNQQRQFQLQIKLTQFGLITRYPNKFYLPLINPGAKSRTNIPNSSSSNISFQYQNQIHALAIILAEMITLWPIDKIYRKLQDKAGMGQLRKALQLQTNKYEYKNNVSNFIMYILQKKQNIKDVIDKYKNQVQPTPYQLQQQFDQYVRWDLQRFNKLLTDNPFTEVMNFMKEYVENKKLECFQIIKKAEKYDPQLCFIFYDCEQMRQFLKQFDITLKEKQAIELFFYMKTLSGVNYMQIIKKIFPIQQVIQAIIKTNLDYYQTRKQFFAEKVGKNQQWRAQDITNYLKQLGVNYTLAEVKRVVNLWANNKDAIKYADFNKIFKQFGKQTLASFNQSKEKSGIKQHKLYDFLNRIETILKENSKNLISFFRSFDLTGRWYVEVPDFNNEIKKLITLKQKQLDQIRQQILQISGVVGQKKKIIQYVILLKQTQICSLTELFKLILCQKINQEGRQKVYRQYEKQSRGWNKDSIVDFNQNQQLDFTKAELNTIFKDLDLDSSGYLSEKQLIFYLTGLKQFDKDFIIEKIKEQVSGKWDLFQLFMRNDKNKDLYLDSPGQIAQIFQALRIQITPQHCQQLFRSGLKHGKFPYMQFLRNFISPTILFIKSCKFFIGHLCKGSFDKFYERGRVKNKKKWNLESFNQINQQFLLGFTYNQIGQIWRSVNKDGEESLTKKQIADIFDEQCEPDENILAIDFQIKQKNREQPEKNKISRFQEPKRRENQREPKQKKQHKNQLVEALLQKNINQMALCFIRKSRYTGQVSLNDFCTCLNELNLKYLEKTVLKNTSQFQSLDEKNNNSMKINYFNFVMYGYELLDEQAKQKRKAKFMSIILNQFLRFYQRSVDQVFRKCKKPGTMKLLDYENLVRDLVKSQVYFDDIEDTWKSWGYPDYLNAEYFNKILGNNGAYRQSYRPEPRSVKQFSFANKQQTRIRQEDPAIQSPRFPTRNTMTRKQSSDSRNENILINEAKFKENDRQHRLSAHDTIKQRQRQRQKQRQTVKIVQNALESSIPQQPKRRNYQMKQTQLQKRFEKKQERKKERQLTKDEVLQKFQLKLKQQGSQNLNNLFMKNNTVGFNQFVDFIENNYGMSAVQSTKLAQALSSFGKIKIDTVKKYLKKIQTSSKSIKKNEEQSRSHKREASYKRQSPKKRDLSKDRMQNELKESQNQRYRLEDPKKLRINVPLVKQHIKILVGSFTKRFDVNQMQPYFFQGNTSIDKQAFIKKCLQINSSISKSMYQKIFAYLKPKQGLISSIAFKLSFSFDEQVTYQQTYLPQQIQQQIKSIFDKADKDKSGTIQYNQLQHILSSLGINETQKDIQTYFQKLDRNNDKKIQLKEFKTFIQQNILPLITDFDQDVDHLTGMLKLNDVFRTGYLPVTTVGIVLERYGVKIGQRDLNTLNRHVANQSGQISIKQLISRLYYPAHQSNPNSLRAVLYRIRWRKKVSFRQIQKIFQNISACFVISYTSQVIKDKIIRPSTFITPVLNQSRFFYNDLYYTNFNKIQQKVPNLLNILKPNDLIVQLRMIDASGIPTPQNQTIKNSILNRSINVTLFDASNQQAKDCILNLKVDFDPDVQDQWVFDKNNRSIFIRIANYDNRRYEKIFVLFQFIVTMVDGHKSLDISCGTVNFPLKDLQVETKVTKKYKMIAGLPNKAKDIDKMSISKRKGFFGFIGSNNADSQLQLQIIPQTKISQKLQLLSALPQKSIVNKKALHLMWTFRQYFAYRSIDQKRINPDFAKNYIVRTFLLCLDIPDVYEQIYPFWKDKIQSKAATVDISRRIFQNLMIDLHVIIHSKQFELLPSYPSKSTYINKNLKALRKKMLQQVFTNIEDWVLDDAKKDYKRKKPYNVDCTPFLIQQRQLNQQTRLISAQLAKDK